MPDERERVQIVLGKRIVDVLVETIPQEAFGQRIVDGLVEFVRRDIKSVADYETNHFKHVGDPKLRRAMAETMYGARWLYVLGIVTLARGAERNAHVRSQIIDYAEICDALLVDALERAVGRGPPRGQAHLYTNPPSNTKPFGSPWTQTNARRRLKNCSFEWHVKVAADEGIVPPVLASAIDQLRVARNSVHLMERAHSGTRYYLNVGQHAKDVLNRTIQATSSWKALNP